MIIDKKMELWMDALRKENETLRREKELLIENSERLAEHIRNENLDFYDSDRKTDYPLYEHYKVMKQVKNE